MADRPRRLRILPGGRRGRRHAACTPTTTAARSRPSCTTCASRASTARASPTAPWPTSSHRSPPGWPTTSAGSRSPRASACRSASQEFKDDLDDYNAILIESLADRLAEAFAERLHQRVRTEFWGHVERRAADQRGPDRREVRRHPARAPGYPACPDHTEKLTLWELLDVEEHTGITLTESMAMWPGASVSGWYFSHPQSQYFVVGRLGRDQVAAYAERKGWTLAEAERWLSPNLGYEPED